VKVIKSLMMKIMMVISNRFNLMTTLDLKKIKNNGMAKNSFKQKQNKSKNLTQIIQLKVINLLISVKPKECAQKLVNINGKSFN
jgi:formyltetrahydrofolate hydrolase